MFFKERIKRISDDDLQFIIKASHFAGMLEEAKTIEVGNWEDLIKAIMDYIEWYCNQDSGDFFEMLENKLTIEFPYLKSPRIGIE